MKFIPVTRSILDHRVLCEGCGKIEEKSSPRKCTSGWIITLRSRQIRIDVKDPVVSAIWCPNCLIMRKYKSYVNPTKEEIKLARKKFDQG